MELGDLRSRPEALVLGPTRPRNRGTRKHVRCSICGKVWTLGAQRVCLFKMVIELLVGGFKHEFYCPFHIWDVILPIDELMFFKMVIAPPTRLNWSSKMVVLYGFMGISHGMYWDRIWIKGGPISNWENHGSMEWDINMRSWVIP